MSRLSLSRLSSLFLPSSLTHGSSFSPFRHSISPFLSSVSRSPISYLLRPAPRRSEISGSVQLGKQVSGSIHLLRGDSEGARKAVGVLGPGLGMVGTRENNSIPYSMSSKRYVQYDSRPNMDSLREFGSTNFVRRILVEDRRNDFMVGSQFPRYKVEQNADIVHIKLMRNNTFMNVTDKKGNTKLKASAGRLEELKGGPKLSRYAAEAIAEYVGRESRKLGIKSVVMRVKGFTYFKKKKQAILSWRDGFTDSRNDQNPIVYIEDATRRPHNGCRLPKRRRV